MLATLIGSADKATMHYFILIVALLLDPASVLLLLAGRIGGAKMTSTLGSAYTRRAHRSRYQPAPQVRRPAGSQSWLRLIWPSLRVRTRS